MELSNSITGLFPKGTGKKSEGGRTEEGPQVVREPGEVASSSLNWKTKLGEGKLNWKKEHGYRPSPQERRFKSGRGRHGKRGLKKV